MKYITYIFDFDYTLADATVGIVESFNHALMQLGFEQKSMDIIKKTVGMPLREAFGELTGIPDKLTAEQFAFHVIEMADKIMTANTVLFDDTIDVLSQLKKRKCSTAVVTNKTRRRINESVEKFDIPGLIDYIVGFEDVENPKPSPEGLIKTIEYFGAPKHSALFVGDTVIDAKAAAGASIDFAAVLTGTTPAQDFEAFPHVCIANNLTDLLEYIT